MASIKNNCFFARWVRWRDPIKKAPSEARTREEPRLRRALPPSVEVRGPGKLLKILCKSVQFVAFSTRLGEAKRYSRVSIFMEGAMAPRIDACLLLYYAMPQLRDYIVALFTEALSLDPLRYFIGPTL